MINPHCKHCGCRYASHRAEDKRCPENEVLPRYPTRARSTAAAQRHHDRRMAKFWRARATAYAPLQGADRDHERAANGFDSWILPNAGGAL